MNQTASPSSSPATPQAPRFDMLNLVYGLGASVVIVGALFKILHWPFGNLVISLGLGVEAIIFAISAFLPADGKKSGETTTVVAAAPDSLGSRFDELLSQARIDRALLDGLRTGIEGLNHSLADAQKVTATFDKLVLAADSADEVQKQLGALANNTKNLNQVYDRLLTATQGSEGLELTGRNMSTAAESSTKVMEGLGKMAQRVEQANGAYASFLNDFLTNAEGLSTIDNTRRAMEAAATEAERVKEGLGKMAQNVAHTNRAYEAMLVSAEGMDVLGRTQEHAKASAESARRMQEELDQLGRRLAELNKVYGRMLNALQARD